MAAAPSVGVRYWLNRRVGVEAGAAISLQATAGNADGPPAFLFATHLALPLAFGSFQHLTPLVMPYGEIDLFIDDAMMKNIVGELGARAGAEVQFGFIGIPELALQATVGLGLRYQHLEGWDHLTVATSVQGQPWDVFLGSIAAIYYF